MPSFTTIYFFFFFSSRRRHTRCGRDWSSDVCSSDLRAILLSKPSSNQREEGFDNKIARLVAADLGYTVENVWWPHRRGFVRNTIRAGLCDVIIGVPKLWDPVLTTKPYYRTTYYFVSRSDRHLDVRSLDDTLLKHLKIGVNLIGYD